MSNSKLNEVVERLFDEQPEEVRNKKFGLDLLKPLPGVQTLLMANRGCGKTTLMREFQERLMREGQVVINVINPDARVDIWSPQLVVEGRWKMPPPSGKKAWEPAKWQGGTDHEAPLKHGKDPRAVAKRRKKKKLASKR